MRNISFDVPEIDYLQLMEKLKRYARQWAYLIMRIFPNDASLQARSTSP